MNRSRVSFDTTVCGTPLTTIRVFALRVCDTESCAAVDTRFPQPLYSSLSSFRHDLMPTTYNELYFPVLLQAGIAMAVAGGILLLSYLLGHRVKDRVKDMPYECGIA